MRPRGKHPVYGDATVISGCSRGPVSPRTASSRLPGLLFLLSCHVWSFWLVSFVCLRCDINLCFYFMGSVCWLAAVCRSWVWVQQLAYCTNTQNTNTAERKPCFTGHSVTIATQGEDMVFISSGLSNYTCESRLTPDTLTDTSPCGSQSAANWLRTRVLQSLKVSFQDWVWYFLIFAVLFWCLPSVIFSCDLWPVFSLMK